MRSISFGLLLAVPAMLFGAVSAPQAGRATQALAALPAWFEPAPPNASGVAFVSRGSRGTLALDARGASVLLPGSAGRLRLSYDGANPRPALEPDVPLGSTSNYFKGRAADWRGAVPHYGRVRYRNLYPGIDVLHYAEGKSLEFDFVVAPGADPSRIRLHWSGASQIRLDRGAILLRSGAASLRQEAPEAYQTIAGRRVPVASRYTLSRGGEVRLAVGGYDRSQPLVIDPVLNFAGYAGGDHTDVINAMALDAAGNLWVTGSTNSAVVIPSGTTPYQDARKEDKDAFLAKIVPTEGGRSIVYWTYLGGVSTDESTAISIDANGGIWIAGTTESVNFPVAGNAFQTSRGGLKDAFIARFNPAESGVASLYFCSYFGGAQNEIPTAILAGEGGNAVVAGYTNAGELPGAVNGVYQGSNRGGIDAFLVFVDWTRPTAEVRRYVTFFGGNGTDIPYVLAWDPTGKLLMAGYTASDDLPANGDPYRAVPASRGDAFLSKFDFTKSGFDILLYTTYLGGSSIDAAEAIAVDPDGSVWLTGYTLSKDFPVLGDVHRAVLAGSADVFLTHLDINAPGAEALKYSTYLGGSGADIAYGIVADGPGRFYLTGYTYSKDFITINSAFPDGAPLGGVDAFLTLIDTNKPGLESIVSSGRTGGSGIDVATGIVRDAAGNVYLGGYTNSKDLPATDGSTKQNGTGLFTGFVLRVGPSVP